MISVGQVYVDKKTGCTEYRKVAGIQFTMQGSTNENTADIGWRACDESGVIFSTKVKYMQGKTFKSRFREV